MKMAYEETIIFDVIDTTQSWSADIPFRELPCVKMTRELNQDNSLSSASIELIKRFLTSYDEYFAQLNPDRLLAMMVHPIMAKHAFAELQIMRDDDGKMFEEAKNILIRCTNKATKKMKFKNTSEGQGTDDTTPATPTEDNEGKTKAELIKEM